MLAMTMTVTIPDELQLWLLRSYICGNMEVAGNKVEAIKKVREHMKCGLLEAKNFVDSLDSRIRTNFRITR